MLRATLRAEDVVGRLGGDEFAAIVPGGDPFFVMRRVVDALAERVSVSAGLAIFPHDGETPDALHAVADASDVPGQAPPPRRRLATQRRGTTPSHDARGLDRAGRDGRRRWPPAPRGRGTSCAPTTSTRTAFRRASSRRTDAADAARGADVLALMVATPEQAQSALDEREPGEPGTIVLVMATVGPEPVARWARELRRWSTRRSRAASRAPREGDLLIMVSGAGPAIERVRPLLDTLARNAPVVGDAPGDGQKVKLVNQLLCGVHIAAAAEALAFAEALGLDARATWEVVRGGAAASFMLDDRGERMLDEAFEEPKSALDIFVKDMGLVGEAARASGQPSPLAAVAEQLYRAGSRAGLGRLDDSSLITLLRDDALP